MSLESSLPLFSTFLVSKFVFCISAIMLTVILLLMLFGQWSDEAKRVLNKMALLLMMFNFTALIALFNN